MNENLFRQKIETLKAFESLNSAQVEKFGATIRQLDDWALLRINPLRFAEQYDFDENECIDIFIHAAKIGLFDFTYNMLCPLCGGIVNRYHELDAIDPEKFYCSVCNEYVPTLLDGQVEVAFTIHPDIRTMDLNPLENITSYHRYYFSENYEQAKEVLAFFETAVKGLEVLKPDEIFTISLKGEPGYAYQFVNVEYNTASWVYFDSQEASEGKDIEISILPGGFTPSERRLSPGDYDLKIRNYTKNRFGFIIIKPELRGLEDISGKHTPRAHPFLTAGRLINTQSFRDLFRVQKLSESLNLNIKNLTIMFTDLKGSTAMYDEAGDMFAYRLVREHFNLLSESVRNHSGAIVKTMGDAIMATFTSPLSGFLCALDMIGKIDRFNEQQIGHGYKIGLKVGLNSGPALTVLNDERLDYFGQAINIAARIQGLASASEVYLSDSVYKEAGVEQLLPEYGYQAEAKQASLKGVGQHIGVYKIYK